MKNIDVPIRVPVDVARPHVADSLAGGSRLCELVAARLSQFPFAFVIAPSAALDLDDITINDDGRRISTQASYAVLVQYMRSLAVAGARTAVVEDDLARKGDSRLGDVAYVDDFVLTWGPLRNRPDAAADVVRDGSSHFPLRGFVSSEDERLLGLSVGANLSEEMVRDIADTTVSVIVSLYDAEAYLALATYPL